MEYIVNKSAQMGTGDHILHTKDCPYKPKSENIKELGEFESERVAKLEAEKFFPSVNGCAYCCKKTHLKR